MVLLCVDAQAAQQQISGGTGVTWGQERAKVNANFTELYSMYTNADIDGLFLQKENSLGNPSTNGYVLSSNTAGTRTWIAPASGGTGLTSMPTLDNQIIQATGDGTYAWTDRIDGLIDDVGVASDSTLRSSLFVQTYVLANKGATAIEGLSDWPGGVTPTELGYIGSVTSDIQSQIDNINSTSISSVNEDPALPAAGQMWFNTSDHSFNVAQATGKTKFAGTFTLNQVYYTLTVSDPGNGDVITCSDSDLSAPLNCGNTNADCNASVLQSSLITGLNATPSGARVFTSWTGAITSNEDPTTTALVMDGAKNVGALFGAAPSLLYDFEEVGTPSGITVYGGVPNFDYTPAIAGSESVALMGKTNLIDTEFTFPAVPAVAGGDVGYKFKVKFVDFPITDDANSFVSFRTGTTSKSQIRLIRTSGVVNLEALPLGGTGVKTTVGLVANTEYYVCVKHNNSNGTNNATTSVSVSTVDECLTSGSGYAVSNNGTETADTNSLKISSDYSSFNQSYNIVVDSVTKL